MKIKKQIILFQAVILCLLFCKETKLLSQNYINQSLSVQRYRKQIERLSNHLNKNLSIYSFNNNHIENLSKDSILIDLLAETGIMYADAILDLKGAYLEKPYTFKNINNFTEIEKILITDLQVLFSNYNREHYLPLFFSTFINTWNKHLRTIVIGERTDVAISYLAKISLSLIIGANIIYFLNSDPLLSAHQIIESFLTGLFVYPPTSFLLESIIIKANKLELSKKKKAFKNSFKNICKLNFSNIINN